MQRHSFCFAAVVVYLSRSLYRADHPQLITFMILFCLQNIVAIWPIAAYVKILENNFKKSKNMCAFQIIGND